MNIFQIISKGYGSGGSKQTLQLAKGLSERGHQVILIVPPESGWEEAISGLNLHMVYSNFGVFEGVREIRPLLKRYKPAICHVHKGKSHFVTWLAKWGISDSFIVANRGVSFPLGFWNSLKYKFGADKVLAVSKAVREVLIKDGIPEKKIDVIYGGTDLEKFNPNVSGDSIREEFGIPEDVPVIGMVAHFREWKGHRYLVNAAREILRKYPQAKFLLVGGGNRTLQNIKKLVVSLNLGKNIVFAGRREDVPECLATMNVSVLSSTEGEGLPGVLRESLAMKKPVVATDVAGASEVIIHEETGLLVPPKSSEDLAKAILYLLEHPELGREMGEKGRKLIEEKFTIKQRLDKIEKLYASLTD